MVERGLGWDIDSPFSAPRGPLFSVKSFGHTGYSGSSIWIDPESDLYVIILTNRRDFRNTASFNQFRRDISTIAAAQFRELEIDSSLASLRRTQSEVSGVIDRCSLPDGKDRRVLVAVQHPSRARMANVLSHIRGHNQKRGRWETASVHRHHKMAVAGHGGQRKGHQTRHRV
jgi:hypothetical protein